MCKITSDRCKFVLFSLIAILLVVNCTSPRERNQEMTNEQKIQSVLSKFEKMRSNKEFSQEQKRLYASLLYHSGRLPEASKIYKGLSAEANGRDASISAMGMRIGELFGDADVRTALFYYLIAVDDIRRGISHAEEFCDEAIKINPEFAPPYFSLASLWGLSRYEKLFQNCIMVLELEEIDGLLMPQTIDLLAWVKNERTKKKWVPPVTNANINEVTEWYGENEVKEANKEMRRRLYAGLLFHVKRFDDAFKLYKEILAEGSPHTNIYYRVAEILMMRGELDSASETLTQGLQAVPKSGRLHYLNGELLLRQNKAKEAHTFYEQAVKLNPEHAMSYYRLAELSASEGNDEKTIHYAISVLELEEQASPLATKTITELLPKVIFKPPSPPK